MMDPWYGKHTPPGAYNISSHLHVRSYKTLTKLHPGMLVTTWLQNSVYTFFLYITFGIGQFKSNDSFRNF